MRYIAFVGILWLLGLTTAATAADPVEIVVNGIEGAALTNVQEALALPAGLVSNGKVDRLWLERFAAKADRGGSRPALEPFGYYKASVKVKLDTVGEGDYRLRVDVDPGKPVHVTAVNVGSRRSRRS